MALKATKTGLTQTFSRLGFPNVKSNTILQDQNPAKLAACLCRPSSPQSDTLPTPTSFYGGGEDHGQGSCCRPSLVRLIAFLGLVMYLMGFNPKHGQCADKSYGLAVGYLTPYSFYEGLFGDFQGGFVLSPSLGIGVSEWLQLKFESGYWQTTGTIECISECEDSDSRATMVPLLVGLRAQPPLQAAAFSLFGELMPGAVHLNASAEGADFLGQPLRSEQSATSLALKIAVGISRQSKLGRLDLGGAYIHSRKFNVEANDGAFYMDLDGLRNFTVFIGLNWN